MDRRSFLKLAGTASVLGGCGYFRIDPMNPILRSDVLNTLDDEQRIRGMGTLSTTLDGRIRVVYLRGSPYERGYQHGALLQKEIQDNLGYLYKKVISKFHFKELFDESFERMRPFIREEYFEEMHGLAHGAQVPLALIHHIHALPEIGEWGGKRKIKEVVKDMMDGKYIDAFATTCSNLSAGGAATADGKMYVVRVLDWGLHRISKLHQYPLLQVHIPENGATRYVNIAWAGFIGAISGMNEQKITLGEMGYGNPPGETLRGKPMPFLLREILSDAKSLKDVRRILSTSPGTNSFVYLMSDGKAKEAELYIRDRSRFLVYKAGENIADRDNDIPGLPHTVYGGHYNDRMTQCLQDNRGTINEQVLMNDIIPTIAMASNFQNVIYKPQDLQFWVSNAASKTKRAAEQPYTFFDFGQALNYTLPAR